MIIEPTGPYERNDLPGIIEKYKIDLIFAPSICPETFSYTVHEVIMMGMPIAVFNLGAQGEAVRDYPKGILLDKIDPEFALHTMINWFRDTYNSSS